LQANGKQITLNLPADYDVRVALDGLKRVRFMAKSPDGRIFATDMFNRADNKRGQVLILDGWNTAENRFARAVPYLQHLRNPNSIAFYTDKSGQAWLYVALTDRLVRYRYKAGDMQPSGDPEVLAHYPDYGLDYKYGGWHLTRTIAFGSITGKPHMFVSVGSSCNACTETEAVRATISIMDPDGNHSMIVVKNVRNAVGLLQTWGTTSLATRHRKTPCCDSMRQRLQPRWLQGNRWMQDGLHATSRVARFTPILSWGKLPACVRE
jgi:glucose/arabinose dehydrogenase